MSTAQTRYRRLTSSAERRTSARGALKSASLLREPVTRSIEVGLIPELACMARFLGRAPHNKPVSDIRRRLVAALDAVEALIVEGAIQPWRRVRLSAEDAQQPISLRPLRLGVYPLSANPIHWGHVLAGLSAMVHGRLDKVVYIVTTEEGRADMLPKESRHEAARELLKSFEPLLCYSPIARETSSDGESSVFHILDLNPTTRIDAFFLAGAKKCRRRNSITGEPETIEKLENGVLRRIYARRNNDGEMHSLSLLFLQGQEGFVAPQTFIPLRFIPSPMPDACSREILHALSKKRDPEVLSALPFSVFHHMQEAVRAGKMNELKSRAKETVVSIHEKVVQI
jgi:hypothetical protein